MANLDNLFTYITDKNNLYYTYMIQADKIIYYFIDNSIYIFVDAYCPKWSVYFYSGLKWTSPYLEQKKARSVGYLCSPQAFYMSNSFDTLRVSR